MANIHAGSWLGLPDFGITEKIGDVLGRQRTSQGGSQLFGSQQASGDTLGVSSGPMQSVQMQSIPGQTTGSFGSTGYAAGGGSARGTAGSGDSRIGQLQKMQQSGGLNPVQQGELDQYMQQAPAQQQINYDALIAPALQALEEAVAPAQAEYGANVAGIEASQARGRGQLQTSLGEAQRSATRRKGEVSTQSESAMDEARRQFAEMQQGLQARYGRTTGTGAFAETYLGGQTLRNISQQRTALTSAITQIDDRLEQVKGITDVALSDIDQQAQAQKLQAKTSLDNALSQIRTAKGELLGRKAELAKQAMEFYQQQVAQVNANNTSFKQQLLRDQLGAEQRLQEARQKASGAVQKLQSVTLGSADKGYTGYAFNPTTGAFSQPTQLGGGQLERLSEEEDDNFVD